VVSLRNPHARERLFINKDIGYTTQVQPSNF